MQDKGCSFSGDALANPAASLFGDGFDREAAAAAGFEEADHHSAAMGDKIDAALLKMGKSAFSSNTWDQIKLGKCIGVGGFSKVYKGFWRGSVVAVKVGAGLGS